MELIEEWRQVQLHDVLLSEYACERGGVKAFVKMLGTQNRWVACIVGHKLYQTKHFRHRIEAQAWAEEQLEKVIIH